MDPLPPLDSLKKSAEGIFESLRGPVVCTFNGHNRSSFMPNITFRLTLMILYCVRATTLSVEETLEYNGGTKVIEAEVSTKPLVLRDGGTPETPVIFDGKGMVIDLGIDVTAHPWIRQGDVWTSDGPIFGREPIAAGQFAGLFLDEFPLSVPRDLAAEKLRPEHKERCYIAPSLLKPGQMGYAEDGSIYFRWPAHKMPSNAKIILPPKAGTSAVTVACSHITIRNITAKHAANDGFNIHGSWTGIRLENVRAISNADEGISAHDDVEMEVIGAEVSWNGSAAGGVADVNRSVTRYRNCEVHHNLGAAFYFSGRSHTVSDTTIHHQSKDFIIHQGSAFRSDRVDWQKSREPVQ